MTRGPKELPVLIVDGQLIEVAAIIEAESPQQCDLCGVIAELRPYGPNGEAVCFQCGMKDEVTTKKMFARRMGWEGEKQ